MTDTHVVLSGSDRPRKQDAVTDRRRRPGIGGRGDGHGARAGPAAGDAGQIDEPGGTGASVLGQPRGHGRGGVRAWPTTGWRCSTARPRRAACACTGTAEQMDAAFRANLGIYRHDGHEYRGREGSLQIPAGLEGIVTGVFGLDQRRVARRVPGIPPYQGSAESVAQDGASHPRTWRSATGSRQGEGEGQTVAIAEFGGAYFPNDLATFCTPAGPPGADGQAGGARGAGADRAAGDGLAAGPARAGARRGRRGQHGRADRRRAVPRRRHRRVLRDMGPEGLGRPAQRGDQGRARRRGGGLGELGAVRGQLGLLRGRPPGHRSPPPGGGAARASPCACRPATTARATRCSDGKAHVNFPACSPHVLAVGGTQLERRPGGRVVAVARAGAATAVARPAAG